jgi:hypothetical protein
MLAQEIDELKRIVLFHKNREKQSVKRVFFIASQKGWAPQKKKKEKGLRSAVPPLYYLAFLIVH